MTAPATKTRALCVATRCTSVDQFVATFHRFCGEDQTFFVATMTSRPVGLETPFSIQLADKQPVLRGLCIVLDAWDTPDNRYKRPGIRLGIKRLTPESQIVFDRLKAAAASPVAMAEATPTPGPAPQPSARGSLPPMPPPEIASLSPPPVVVRPVLPLRAPATPPPVPRIGLPPVRNTTPPPLPSVLGPPPPATDPPLPAIPRNPAAVARPDPPIYIEKPTVVASESGLRVSFAPVAPATPAPVSVTRFQVALNVATEPPPVHDVEFKPIQLVPRLRPEPRIVSEPADAPVDPAHPAMIVDRPIATRDTLPSVPLAELAADLATIDPAAPGPRSAEITTPWSGLPVPDLAAPSSIATALTAPSPVALAHAPTAPSPTVPGVASDLRTPGSAYVLPANPLHNLSDESLEGFIDCTIYEESGNFFHPGIDDQGFSDESADPPSTPLASRAPTAIVPAMPFDAAPNVLIRALGQTESLVVTPGFDYPLSGGAPLDPHAAPPPSPLHAGIVSDTLFVPTPEVSSGTQTWPDPGSAHPSPHAGRREPWQEPTGSPYSADHPNPIPRTTPTVQVDPGFGPVETFMSGPIEPMSTMPPPGYPPYGYSDPSAAVPAPFDPAQASYATAHIMLPAPPRAPIEWRRWLLIGGTALASIVIAFVIARQVRGPQRAAAPPVITAPARPRAVIPPAPAPVVTAGSDTATSDPVDDSEPVAGSAPTVGSGPCRLTLATTPAGSLVRLDDQAVGASPLTVQTTCDKHKLEIAHARYQTVTRSIALAADKPEQLDIALLRPVHAVTVTSQPPGAELSIDGRRAGTTPTVIQMMGFATVKLTFTKPGFQTITTKVYSKTPQDRVSVKLTK
jgi:hypothetical protein